MSIKKITTTIAILLLNTIFTFAQNILSVPEITVAAGETIGIPIHLDNTADVVAVQFTLELPEGITLAPSTAKMSERADGHTVTMRRTASGKYMAMIFSSRNNPFKGRTGKIMTVNLSAGPSMEYGSVHTMTLSDVVIGGRDGANLATGFTTGKLNIAKAPDLAVTDVITDLDKLTPGEKVVVSWKVTNVGGSATRAGWNEQVTLESPDGNTVSLVGRTYYNDILAAEASMSRQAEMVVPELPAIDGDAILKVRLIANSDAGERSETTENNTAQCNVTLGKRLFLSIPETAIEENIGTPIRCKLSRSGNRNEAENFALTYSEGNRLEGPLTLVIPALQSEVYFYVTPIDNDTIDNVTQINITANGGNYLPASAPFVLKDNEFPTLTITASKSIINEGEKFILTIRTDRKSENPIKVNLTSEYNNKYTFPAEVTIPSGESEITTEVSTVDDGTPDASLGTTFYATATDYNGGETVVLLHDNDLPEIELTLTPDTINESAGPTAVKAILRRLTNSDKKATIKLSDDSEGEIRYSTSTITLDEGVKESEFTIGVTDNNLTDGDRSYSITAAIFLTACNCSATGTNAGIVTAALTVLDNDAPSLTVTSSKTMLLEGVTEATMLTISRNTDTTAPLTVNISTNNDEALDYTHSVTIPAGETSVTIPVAVKDNDEQTEDYTVVFTATAIDHAKGTCWAMVSDRTLPDAVITALQATPEEIEAGDKATISITIANDGKAVIPAKTKISLTLDNTLLTTLYTQEALEAGNNTTVVKEVQMPNVAGIHTLTATINDEKNTKELTYTNNTYSTDITLYAGYTLTIKTDKSIYQQGETVTINGIATGKATDKVPVEILITNNNIQQKLNVTTDSKGRYSTTWKPYANQAGRFTVSAAQPGASTTAEQTTFDIYGIKITGNGNQMCETTVGEPYNGSITLSNPGELTLTDIRAEIISSPENCTVTITGMNELQGNTTAKLDYTIIGSKPSAGSDWEQIKIRVTTAEGATTEQTLYYYCRSPKGLLKANIESINTTMIKGKSRDYTIIVTNVGKGETGKISLALPNVPWMTAVTPREMTSLAQGESTTIILRLTPTEDMQLNVPQSGKIGVNCENGTGLSMSYNIEPVSQSDGTLVVDVRDEYTYYTAEAPHLKGAKVVIKHPVTDAIIAQGTTDGKGLYTIKLLEGYYKLEVTADKHDSYTNTILVDPGRENSVIVDLSFQAVTVDWKVEETEIKDEYKIVTTVKYETNVPAPAVILEIPERIDGDNMAAGESTLVYFTVTNKGLVTAFNTVVHMPENSAEWKFEALESTGPFDLLAQQAKSIPVVITHLTNGESTKANATRAGKGSYNYYGACMAHVETSYEIICGEKIKTNRYAKTMAMKLCGTAAIGATILDVLSDIYNGGWGRVDPPAHAKPVDTKSPTYKPKDESPTIKSGKTFSICDTCDAKRASDMVDILLSKTSLSLINDAMNNAIEDAVSIQQGEDNVYKKRISKKALDKLMEAIREANEATMEYLYKESKLWKSYKKGKKFIGYIQEILDVIEVVTGECPKQEKGKIKSQHSESASDRSWQESFNIAAKELSQYISYLPAILDEFYGDTVWYNSEIEAKSEFFNYIAENEEATLEELLAIKPDDVTDEQVEKLWQRIENFANGDTVGNTINISRLNSLCDEATMLNEAAMRNGYESIYAQFEKKLDTCIEHYEESSSSVCASITLQFTQQMTMTRQAFRGTLSVFNGHETTAMENVRLTLEIKDEFGNTATTREFQTNAESLTNFNGELSLNGGWSLEAGNTGVATILFIPTKHAAPTTAIDYSFGGTLTYTDPFTGLEVTRTLTPVILTVKPSPQLDLTYFMQRNIYGDDPLTEPIEPMKEAEFSLLINNIGYGDATNVRMVTQQPEIIDNEKGLLINFELLSSQLNGKEKSMALGGDVATDYGTIKAGSTTYTQWWLTSSLLGHFTEYEVEATHVTSYDNPDLSLLNDVTIHELIRSLEIAEDTTTTVGFLVNDIVDANDEPDMLYMGNGKIDSVKMVTAATIVKECDTIYTMKVTPSFTGWNYGNIIDPTYGTCELVSAVRQSNGQSISLRNIWQTDRTLRDGHDPLYENRIHFADNFAGTEAESYILTFKPLPAVGLEVKSISGTPEAGKSLNRQLTEVSVTFSKAIEDSTFTTDDLALSCQGEKVSTAEIVISKKSETEYTLNLSEVTLNDGYYVLTVQTAEITDYEGYKGKVGKQATWTQFVHGQAALKITASPAEGGTLSHSSGYYPCDSTITLKATPAADYDFSHWISSEVTLGNDTALEYTVTDNAEVTAVFIRKFHALNVQYDSAAGEVEDAAAGIYKHGTTLTLRAVACDECTFDGWMVNGTDAGKQDTLTVTMDSTIDVTANFRRVIYHQKHKIYKGWNWISSYILDDVSIEALSTSIDRIVSQFEEVIRDPEYGLIGDITHIQCGKGYKMEALYTSLRTLDGRMHYVADKPIAMRKGWNWISYPYYDERPIASVITNAEEGDIITSQDGFTEFADGYWEGTIENLVPGYGYIYKSASDKKLAFDFSPAGSGKATKIRGMERQTQPEATYNVDKYKYPNTMNITAKMYDGEFDITDEEYIIYAMCGNECRGVSKLSTEKYYITVYGEKPEDISFVVENLTTGETYLANETVTFNGDVVGSRKAPYIINIDRPTGIGTIDGEQRQMKVYTIEGVLIYPNADKETLKSLPKGIYIIDGKKYRIK